MKNAESMFGQLYYESLEFVKKHGFVRGDSWHRVAEGDLSQDTVDKLYLISDRYQESIDYYEANGCGSKSIEFRREALEMARNTIDNEQTRIHAENDYRIGLITFEEYRRLVW